MNKRSTLLGLSVASGAMGAFVWLMGAVGDEPDLAVSVDTSEAIPVASPDAPLVETRGRARAEPWPAEALPRDRARYLADIDGPGLHVTQWAARYAGDSYHREVSWPVLVGPFEPAEPVCGVELHMGAGIFDRNGAGNGLIRTVEAEVARRVPSSVPVFLGVSARLPKLLGTRAHVELQEDPDNARLGRVVVAVELSFQGGGRAAVAAPVSLIADNGQLRVERAGPARLALNDALRVAGAYSVTRRIPILGPTVGGWLAKGIVDIGRGAIDAQAQVAVDAHLAPTVEEVSARMAGLTRPFPTAAGDDAETISLSFAASPTVYADHITFDDVCLELSGYEPTGPGAIPILKWPRVKMPDYGGALVEVSVPPRVMQHVVSYLWRTGELRTIGRSTAVLDLIDKRVQMAAFDFEGLVPRLAPLLVPSGSKKGAFSYVMADVRLGARGDLDVVAHAKGQLAIHAAEEGAILDAAVDEIWMNCAGRKDDAVALTPCFSDLLPLVRDELAKQELSLTLDGGELLARLPALRFEGVEVELSDLRMRASGAPPVVSLAAELHTR